MRVLLDTNILIRSISRHDPQREVAGAAVQAMLRKGHELCAVPQVFYEFFVVATRPTAQNGLGLSPELGATKLAEFESVLELLPDLPLVYTTWREIIGKGRVSGKAAHDARLAAAMRAHGVSTLLSFNIGDFRRHESISVLEPRDVVSG